MKKKLHLFIAIFVCVLQGFTQNKNIEFAELYMDSLHIQIEYNCYDTTVYFKLSNQSKKTLLIDTNKYSVQISKYHRDTSAFIFYITYTPTEDFHSKLSLSPILPNKSLSKKFSFSDFWLPSFDSYVLFYSFDKIKECALVISYYPTNETYSKDEDIEAGNIFFLNESKVVNLRFSIHNCIKTKLK